MATTNKELGEISAEFFNRAWEIVKACDDREKHFNGLQAGYRTLASTWLLAAVGGMAFALSTDLKVPLPREALVSGLAVAGALGIALLWVLDVLVYHDLLIVGHTVGKHLEQSLSWLPPIRSRFKVRRQHPPVRVLVAIFYIAGVDVLCVAAVVTLLSWGSTNSTWIAVPIIAGSLLTVVIVAVTGRALKWLATAPPWIVK
jgi:hypothetical protein